MHHGARSLLPALLAGAIASSTGCADPSEPLGPRGPLGPLELSAIPEAQPLRFNSGLDTQQRLVIRDARTWASLWSQIAARIQPLPAPPAIDFDSKLVVVASMGTRPSGGYTIDIDDVRIIDNAVQLSVTETSPGVACGGSGALTTPIAVATVTRFDTQASFAERTTSYDCE